jgi:hypothetical protein
VEAVCLLLPAPTASDKPIRHLYIFTVNANAAS